MIFVYIFLSFIAISILSWLFNIIGINIFEGPDSSALYVYASIIIGILFEISSKLNKSEKRN
ncbi:hypothetical protein SAMN05720606_1195 [Paenibacillus polysaccharolyticus]|uniref:Uncharacterized protein n=1 Tax=Paenibacillus polysaccharolyticus TaxID=582692 RepID=A0A1G5L1H7_9BACL|nr:hypothetical protein SAMN05720606_1195 [Paenibacillus polysaccharolyticus]